MTTNNYISLTATAKRKTSVSKVILYKDGTGQILVNKQKLQKYFKNLNSEYILMLKPLILFNLHLIYDIFIYVKGGGIKSQLNAIILSISNVITKINISYKSQLKKNLILNYDLRIKERRKYGLKKARKASQYSKR